MADTFEVLVYAVLALSYNNLGQVFSHRVMVKDGGHTTEIEEIRNPLSRKSVFPPASL